MNAMKIGIISDIHDHVWNLSAAMEHLQSTDTLICCGDLCAPFIVGHIADALSAPIHIVFGNNDGDGCRIAQNAGRHQHVHLHQEHFFGELGGRQFAVNHYPEIARGLAKGGQFDVVCYGHNHRHSVEVVERTLLINPGALMGYDGVQRVNLPPTFMVYDTESGALESFQVRVSGEAPTPARTVVPFHP